MKTHTLEFATGGVANTIARVGPSTAGHTIQLLCVCLVSCSCFDLFVVCCKVVFLYLVCFVLKVNYYNGILVMSAHPHATEGTQPIVASDIMKST